MTQKILIIKAGSTHPEIQKTQGDFEQWTQAAMGTPSQDTVVVDADKKQKLPFLKNISGVVITGSHDFVTDKTGKQKMLAVWVEEILQKDLPLLGVCYGHQLIAKVLGGQVGEMPSGPEYGTRKITLTHEGKTDPLFSLLSNSFDAQTAHFQMVTKLPKEAVILAHNKKCPYQAIRFRPYVWGVQFHPEFNMRIMEGYIEATQKYLTEKNSPVRIRKTVRPTYGAAEVLYRFAQLCDQPNTPFHILYEDQDPF